jgi:hypothetical protein
VATSTAVSKISIARSICSRLITSGGLNRMTLSSQPLEVRAARSASAARQDGLE